MSVQETLQTWQNFFVVTGGAATALIGLMFVAISLGTHLVRDDNLDAIRAFVSPILLHFISIFLIACIALIPIHTAISLSLTVGALALYGIINTLRVGQYMRQHPSHGIDEDNHWLWHFYGPFSAYGVGTAAMLGLAITAHPGFLVGIGILIPALSVCAIHNVWILVLWIAKQGEG